MVWTNIHWHDLVADHRLSPSWYNGQHPQRGCTGRGGQTTAASGLADRTASGISGPLQDSAIPLSGLPCAL